MRRPVRRPRRGGRQRAGDLRARRPPLLGRARSRRRRRARPGVAGASAGTPGVRAPVPGGVPRGAPPGRRRGERRVLPVGVDGGGRQPGQGLEGPLPPHRVPGVRRGRRRRAVHRGGGRRGERLVRPGPAGRRRGAGRPSYRDVVRAPPVRDLPLRPARRRERVDAPGLGVAESPPDPHGARRTGAGRRAGREREREREDPGAPQNRQRRDYLPIKAPTCRSSRDTPRR